MPRFRAVSTRGRSPPPDLRLRPHATDVLRGRTQPAARTCAHLRAGRRAGDRALLAGAGRRRRRRQAPRHHAVRGGRRGSLAPRGRGTAPADLRRAARRLPQRRASTRARWSGSWPRSWIGRCRPSRSASRTARASTSGRTPGWSRSTMRTDHHEFVVQPRAVDLIERLVWHHDQPFGDSSAVPTFLLSELTRGEVTVALSGDGGDEGFAGYERFAAGLAARRFAALPASGPAHRNGGRRVAALGGPARARRQAAAVCRGRRAGASRRLSRLDQHDPGPRARFAARWAPRQLGRRRLPRDLGLVSGRAPARPPARPQPAHLPASTTCL